MTIPTLKYLAALTINGTPVQAPGGIPTGGLSGKGNSIISHGITFLIVSAAIFALFMIIISGIQWITSGGDKTKLQAARNRLIFSIVGLLVVLFSFLIIGLVGNFLGISLFPTSGPDCGRGTPC